MKATLSVCIAAALLGATLIVNLASQGRAVLIDSALAQPGKPPPTFDLYVCNDSRRSLKFAMIGIEGNQLHAKGWSQIANKRDCRTAENYVKFGAFGRPAFWWHATDGEITWFTPNAAKVGVCVNFDDDFDYTWDGKSRECKTGEQLVDFYEERVKDGQRSYPLWLGAGN